MGQITANDLKTRGIAAIESALAGGRTEVVVSVRGAARYVVMELSHYEHLRECELAAALSESRAEIAAGRYAVESPAQHLDRVRSLIAADPGPPSKAKPSARSSTKASRRSAR